MSQRTIMNASGFSILPAIVIAAVAAFAVYGGYAISERSHSVNRAAKKYEIKDNLTLRLKQLLIHEVDCTWHVSTKIVSSDNAYWSELLGAKVSNTKFVRVPMVNSDCACYIGSIGVTFEDLEVPVTLPIYYVVNTKDELLACTASPEFLTSENNKEFMGTRYQFSDEDDGRKDAIVKVK